MDISVKFFLIILIFSTSSVITLSNENKLIRKSTNTKDWHNLIITDPAISTRCTRLLVRRKEKIRIKQKISYLILRTKKLLDKTKKNQQTVINSLTRVLGKLERESKLSKLTLQKMTENIILKGCPGIEL